MEYDENEGVKTVPVTFYLQAAGHQQTRAYIGDVDEEEGEDAINSVKVWLFDNTTGRLLDYTDAIDNGKVTLNVLQTFISSGHTADVYVIANGAAAGITADRNVNTREALETITFGATANFTAATPTTSIPSAGLPMSRIVKGLSIVADGKIKENLETIKLTRAVSKIHFAFARTSASQGEVLGVMLNSNQIADKEYIFPVDPANNAPDYTAPYLGDLHANITANSYESSAMTLGYTTAGSGVLVENSRIIDDDDNNTTTEFDPTAYVWTTWTAAAAQSGLSNQQKATNYNSLMKTKRFITNTVYLRESDKNLRGSVYYRQTPTGAVKTAYFSMSEPTVQDFARNHVWIVYGYFLGDKFNLIIETIPWEDSFITIDYTQTPSWKDPGGTPTWTPTLDSTNSGTETINGVDYTAVYVNGGNTPSCSFILDSPVGWEWMAVLEPLTDGANNFISFADGNSVATGSVGQNATLNFRIATTTTSVQHRVRLRIYVRTTTGDQSCEVHSAKYIISRNI